MGLLEKLELNPIIAAVKDEKTLKAGAAAISTTKSDIWEI